MISKLAQPNAPFTAPLGCALGRTESSTRVFKNGKVYTMTWRDKIAVEDPYLVMVKAAAYAIQCGEPFGARSPSRSFKDYLIKSTVII